MACRSADTYFALTFSRCAQSTVIEMMTAFSFDLTGSWRHFRTTPASLKTAWCRPPRESSPSTYAPGRHRCPNTATFRLLPQSAFNLTRPMLAR